MHNISLKYRIALIIFLLEAIMTTLILWQTGAKFSTEIGANIHEKEKALVDVLSDLSRYALINSEYGELRPYIEKMSSGPFVSSIVIADYRNKIVSATDTKLIGREMFSTTDRESGHWRTQEITNPAGLLGSLAIEFSTAPLQRARLDARNYGIAVALISMIIIAVFGVVSGFILTRRINRLALATRDIAGGNMDVSLEISGKDEIALLAQDIQGMSAQINTHINELKESEARYHSMFSSNQSVMLFIDPDTGDIVDANPAACKFYGYDHKELTNKKILEINQLSDEEVQQEMTNAKLEKRNHFYFRHRLKDGTIKDVEVYSGPVFIADHELLYSIINDITEKKLLEESLRRSEKEWERTFNAITDIVSLQDPSMKIVKVNQAGCDTLGLSCQEIIGKHCYELFRGIKEPCPECPLLISKETFEPYTKEMTHEKLGKTFLLSAAPVLNEQGELTHISHVAADISERKQNREELAKYRKHLEGMVKKRTAELQTIVNAMAGREIRMAELKKENKNLREQLQDGGIVAQENK